MQRVNTKGYMWSLLKTQTKRNMSECVPKSQEVSLHKLSGIYLFMLYIYVVIIGWLNIGDVLYKELHQL